MTHPAYWPVYVHSHTRAYANTRKQNTYRMNVNAVGSRLAVQILTQSSMSPLQSDYDQDCIIRSQQTLQPKVWIHQHTNQNLHVLIVKLFKNEPLYLVNSRKLSISSSSGMFWKMNKFENFHYPSHKSKVWRWKIDLFHLR